MREVVVAAVQMESFLGDFAANIRKAKSWIDKASEASVDILVFPECSVTGYSSAEAATIALDPNSNALANLERYATALDLAIGYGFVERRNDSKRNSQRGQDEPPIADGCSEGLANRPYITYAITDGTSRLNYRKTHLGSRERDAFTPGADLPVADIAGVRMGVQLCWEGHIPDIATTLRTKGAELLIAPHASGVGGLRRLETWARYLPARASDNGMFAIACNAIREGAGGGLAAYSPDGSLLDTYDGADEHMLIVRIGGALPRELPEGDMRHISYFDRRRPELYR